MTSSSLLERSSGDLRWCEAGDGDETVVFLHPVIGTRHYWLPQLEALSATFRCVAVDAPGYGHQSGATSEPEAIARHIVALFDSIDVESVHLVGLSLGAMYAMYTMEFAPARVDSVVLADSSAAFGVDPDAWLTDWLGPLDAGVPLDQVAADAIDAIVASPLAPAVRSSLVRSFGLVHSDGFRAASRCIAAHDRRSALPALTHRCLVVVGERDEETPPRYSEELARLLCDARVEVIGEAGHLTSIEAPDRFNELVGEFLT